MIPAFDIKPIELFGPFAIQPFGALVAIGILLGAWVAQRLAEKEGVDVDEMRSAIAWAVVPGFIGAHLVAILLYHPERISEDGPLVLLKLWDGISSYGGVFGAFVGLITFYKLRKQQWLHTAEILVQAFVVGWIFGRSGCFVAFDHPGTETDFFMGQMYSDGVVRHNLGLYEMLYTLLVIGPAILLARRFNPPQGGIILVVTLLYAPIRFVLDSLRTVDVRYGGLTPAQWSCFAIVALGIIAFQRGRKRPRLNELVETAAAAPATPTQSGARSGGKSGKGKPSNRRRR